MTTGEPTQRVGAGVDEGARMAKAERGSRTAADGEEVSGPQVREGERFSVRGAFVEDIDEPRIEPPEERAARRARASAWSDSAEALVLSQRMSAEVSEPEEE